MSKSIIFGASGQTGSYLASILSQLGHQVIKVSRRDSDRQMDIAVLDEVEKLILQEQPDFIFHLAAQSSTRHDALFDNHRAISTGTLNVLESAYRHVPHARIFITGSGVQFLNLGPPINEKTPFEALSPYAVARIHSVYAARYYRKLGLKAYVGYLFHHESPRRPHHHVSQLVAQAALAIAEGRQSRLKLGDITVRKEWTFAGDVAEAIYLLTAQDAIHEAVIGSGELHSIREWVEACFSALGLNWESCVDATPGFQAEYSVLASDPTLIKSLGWAPKRSFLDLARIMVGKAQSS